MTHYKTVLNVPLPLELGEELEAEVTYHIENDGIGHYEYWGAHCFDRGSDYAEIDDIVPIFEEENPLKDEILQYIEENYEKLADNLSDKISIEFGDYDDRDQ